MLTWRDLLVIFWSYFSRRSVAARRSRRRCRGNRRYHGDAAAASQTGVRQHHPSRRLRRRRSPAEGATGLGRRDGGRRGRNREASSRLDEAQMSLDDRQETTSYIISCFEILSHLPKNVLVMANRLIAPGAAGQKRPK